MPSPSLPECPEGLFICTPPETALKTIRTDNLPWINFVNVLGRNSTPYPFEVSFDISELAAQFPVIKSIPPSAAEPSFGLEVFEESSNEWLADAGFFVSETPRQLVPALYAPQNVESFLSKDEPLGLLTSTLERFHSKARTSEDDSGEFQKQWDLQLGLSDLDLVTRILKIFMYLSSNNQFAALDFFDYNFFDWILANLPSNMLDALLLAESPTSLACIEHVFEASLARMNVELARSILGKRNNLLQRFARSKKFDELFEAAVALDDAEIVRYFIDANVNSGTVAPLRGARSAEVVKVLLNSGIDVNTLYTDHSHMKGIQYTALFWATSCGRTAVVQALIQNKADVNIAAKRGLGDKSDEELRLTPLRAAIDQAVEDFQSWDESDDSYDVDFELIKILLAGGANINTPSLTLKRISVLPAATPLQIASTAGHISLSKLLLDHGADVNAPACPEGQTALMAAVMAGHVELVRMLLHRGAKVDAPGFHESEPQVTSLMTAIDMGVVEIVKELLEAGADPNSQVVNHFGLCALEVAEYSNDDEIMEILVQFGASRDIQCQQRGQLIRSIFRKDSASVQKILDGGMVLTHPHGFRSQLLIEAIESGDETILLLLLQSGIDTNKKIQIFCGELDYGCPDFEWFSGYMTPLGYALFHEKIQESAKLATVSMILRFGADPNACVWAEEFKIQPPLHFVVSRWIEQRVKFSRSDKDGLHAEYAGLPLIRLLLKGGASPNMMGNSVYLGKQTAAPSTALQVVANDVFEVKWSESLEAAEILLDAGADPNLMQVDPYRPKAHFHQHIRSPLQVAASYHNLKLVQFLLQHNANVNTPALGSGKTALQAAIYSLDIERTTHNMRNIEQISKPAHSDSLATIELLLEKGADVNAPPAPGLSGITALQAAVLKGRLDLSTRLIDLGADVDAPGGGTHGTAIQIAACSGNLEIAHLLIDHGANVNTDCSSVLWAENYKGHAEYVQFAELRTALESAAYEGRLDMVQLLINARADTHLPGGRRYRRAEKFARDRGHIAVANLLQNHFEDAT